jgi:hypothetical protein
LESFLNAETPSKANVILLLVDDNSIYRNPDSNYTIGVSTTVDWEEDLDATRHALASEIVAKIEAKIKLVQKSAARPRSCIISNLLRASELLEADGDVGILIISDMMENCKDWDPAINMERDIDDLANVKVSSLGFRLDGISRVFVRQAAHERTRRAIRAQEIRSAWFKLLQELGVPKASIEFGSALPDYWFPSSHESADRRRGRARRMDASSRPRSGAAATRASKSTG